MSADGAELSTTAKRPAENTDSRSPFGPVLSYPYVVLRRKMAPGTKWREQLTADLTPAQWEQAESLFVCHLFYGELRYFEGWTHEAIIDRWLLDFYLPWRGISKEHINDLKGLGRGAAYHYKKAVVDEGGAHEETIVRWIVNDLRENCPGEKTEELLAALEVRNELRLYTFVHFMLDIGLHVDVEMLGA